MTVPKIVKRKRVTIHCGAPFRIGYINFTGVCNKVVLDVADIAKCIENKAMVEEVLSNGQTIPLNFSNYNTYNGPTDVVDDTNLTTDVVSHKQQEIPVFDENNNEIIKKTQVRFGGGFRKPPVLQPKNENIKVSDPVDIIKEDTIINKPEIEQTTTTNSTVQSTVKEVKSDIPAQVNVTSTTTTTNTTVTDTAKKNDIVDVNADSKDDLKAFDYTQQPNKKKNKY